MVAVLCPPPHGGMRGGGRGWAVAHVVTRGAICSGDGIAADHIVRIPTSDNRAVSLLREISKWRN